MTPWEKKNIEYWNKRELHMILAENEQEKRGKKHQLLQK